MPSRKAIPPTLSALSGEERALTLAVALEGSAAKESLIRRLAWGTTKLNGCLAALKRRGVFSVSTLPKDGTGRKPLSYALDPGLGLFLGIQCDLAADYFVLVDASGARKAAAAYPVLQWEDRAVSAILENLDDFLTRTGLPASQILAAGVSSAIRFNQPDQKAKRSPSYTNEAIQPLVGAVEDRLGVAVSLGRPQVLLCHQGTLRTLVNSRKSFINIMATDNLGIAIFLHGESWLGQSGLSGDLGHLKVSGNELPCYCGAVGCLRTKLSYMGICQETRRRLAELGPGGGTRRLDPADFEGPDYERSVERLIEAANDHDALATGVVYDAATDLGTALASVVSLFNPELMFVHSILTDARDVFAERVRAMIRKNCLELYSRALTLEFRRYSPEENAEGAALFCKDEYFKSVLGGS